MALREQFNQAMFDIYRRVKDEAGYTASQFLEMLNRDGGLLTAKQLINSTQPSSGYTALYERGRLDLTVEAVVLGDTKWHELFSREELKRAHVRLVKYGYEAPTAVRTNNESTTDREKAFEYIRKLIEARGLKKEVLASVDTKYALQAIARVATSTERPEDRLAAVALLGKTGEISKPAETAVIPLLRAALADPLSAPEGWGTADDHFYLAKALAHSEQQWIAAYAARQFVVADVSERKSRDIWVQLAVERLATFSEILALVASAFESQARKGPDGADTAHRRLIRIAESLDSALALARKPVGEHYVAGLADLCRPVIGASSTDSKGRQLREEAAIALLNLLSRQSQMRFEVILDSDLYRALRHIRNWWRPGQPPRQVDALARQIAKDAISALHTLARQGVRDNELREAIVQAFDRKLVNQLGTALAEGDPLLSGEDATWLARGEYAVSGRVDSEFGAVAAGLELDQIVARMVLIEQKSAVDPSQMRATASEIEVLEPEIAKTLRAAAEDRAGSRQWIAAIARIRNIEVEQNMGEIVGFDPGVHDAEGDLKRDQKVQVTSPAAFKQEVGRPKRTLLKATVIPV